MAENLLFTGLLIEMAPIATVCPRGILLLGMETELDFYWILHAQVMTNQLTRGMCKCSRQVLCLKSASFSDHTQ